MADLLGQFLVLHTLLADGACSPRKPASCWPPRHWSATAGWPALPSRWAWSALNGATAWQRLYQGVTLETSSVLGAALASARADWAWSADVAAHLSHSPFHDDPAASPGRRPCSQYRESDHAFIQRLLAEEGIGYAFEEAGARC